MKAWERGPYPGRIAQSESAQCVRACSPPMGCKELSFDEVVSDDWLLESVGVAGKTGRATARVICVLTRTAAVAAGSRS
eukprot:1411112-Pleurochrysis_carterae.AAC.3